MFEVVLRIRSNDEPDDVLDDLVHIVRCHIPNRGTDRAIVQMLIAMTQQCGAVTSWSLGDRTYPDDECHIGADGLRGKWESASVLAFQHLEQFAKALQQLAQTETTNA